MKSLTSSGTIAQRVPVLSDRLFMALKAPESSTTVPALMNGSTLGWIPPILELQRGQGLVGARPDTPPVRHNRASGADFLLQAPRPARSPDPRKVGRLPGCRRTRAFVQRSS